jgi:hypothetical protein
MGYAKVIGGGALGRYTIELDYGASTRTAILAAINANVAALNVRLSETLVKISEADAKEALQSLHVQAAQEAYIAESIALPPGSPSPSSALFKFEVYQLTLLQLTHAPLRRLEVALQFDLATSRKRLAYWEAFSPIETRQAWCTDLTEDRAPGSFVATMDIPGESALIVLAPGARAWQAGDGILTARELMSPEQAFFNAAILPGWQKDKPTYRWGTITALDKPSSLCSVALFDAKSSAQRLPVNKTNTLAGVPITYMNCDGDAFELDDRVVVQFLSQDWDQPVVVGFLDNPRACRGWKFSTATHIQLGVSGPERYLIVVFESLMQNDRYYADLAAATTTAVDFRINRGAWVTLPGGLVPGAMANGRWEQNAAYLVVDLIEPGSIPVSGGASFTFSPGTPAHFRVGLFIDSGWAPGAERAPFYPLDSTLEVRLRLNGSVFANAALKAGFAPYVVDCDRPVLPESGALQLDYMRFIEDGT